MGGRAWPLPSLDLLEALKKLRLATSRAQSWTHAEAAYCGKCSQLLLPGLAGAFVWIDCFALAEWNVQVPRGLKRPCLARAVSEQNRCLKGSSALHCECSFSNERLRHKRQ